VPPGYSFSSLLPPFHPKPLVNLSSTARRPSTALANNHDRYRWEHAKLPS
jgi:hypothetical protein